MPKIRIVLIEDNELSRIGLTAALQQFEDIEVVGAAANAHQGLQILTVSKPDVAVVDVALPDQDGIELTQAFKGSADSEQTKVLILTMHDDEDLVLAAFAAGADSYSLKDVSLENLVQAIRLTHEGNSWIDPTIARAVLQQVRSDAALAEAGAEASTVEIRSINPDEQQMIEANTLTDRELDVLELIVGGCTNAAIAEQLHITIGTVKTHVRSILNKLCADDRTQAAVRALRSGIVE
ncbi:MAG: response regulator [Spirulinaceae cyanobacterium]